MKSKMPVLKMNIIDRAVSVFSPQRGLDRARARTTLHFMAGSVSRTGAGRKGSLANWIVKRLTRHSEARERITVNDRAADLVANNPHAASIVESSALHTVGAVGLTPQSKPMAKLLGIDEDAAAEVAEQAEWSFREWSKEADVEGMDHFSDIQYLTIRNMLGIGEYLNLPVMLDDPNRSLSLAIQVLDTRRLRTPYDLASKKEIRDGIQLGPHSERRFYYVAEPDDGLLTTNLASQDFRVIPARRGHRPGILHGFIRKDAEQVRGQSVLAPVIKLFRDYDDYMDYELIGAILSASFPVFIETPEGEDPEEYTGDTTNETSPGGKTTRYKEYEPGQVLYGSIDQKPHILKSDRPGNSFPTFVETLLRTMGAPAGLAYEITTKDFSKTNYSSARAALLETWKVINFYQTWLVNHHNQPIWDMVFEEAWLRGKIKLPAGAPDFYVMRRAWTNATWTPPKRGHIDPVKEVASGKEAIISNMQTLANWYAEQGLDWEEQLRQIAKERQRMKDLDLTMSDLPGFDTKQIASQPEGTSA